MVAKASGFLFPTKKICTQIPIILLCGYSHSVHPFGISAINLIQSQNCKVSDITFEGEKYVSVLLNSTYMAMTIDSDFTGHNQHKHICRHKNTHAEHIQYT